MYSAVWTSIVNTYTILLLMNSQKRSQCSLAKNLLNLFQDFGRQTAAFIIILLNVNISF